MIVFTGYAECLREPFHHTSADEWKRWMHAHGGLEECALSLMKGDKVTVGGATVAWDGEGWRSV